MSFEFHLPDIGEGVIEGEIVAWKVQEGESIDLDQPMVEIMTDKATVEIPSPKAGTVVSTHGGVGEVVAVGQTLVVIDLGDGAAACWPRPRRGGWRASWEWISRLCPVPGGTGAYPPTTYAASPTVRPPPWCTRPPCTRRHPAPVARPKTR